MGKYTKSIAVYMSTVFVKEMDSYCDYTGFTRGKLLRRLLTDAWKKEKEENNERYEKAIAYERENNSNSENDDSYGRKISRQTTDLQ